MPDPHAQSPAVALPEPAADAVLPEGVEDDRRGKPVETVGSYWSRKERALRAAVFQRRADGLTVAQISAESGLSEHEVQATLLSDRRARR